MKTEGLTASEAYYSARRNSIFYSFVPKNLFRWKELTKEDDQLCIPTYRLVGSDEKDGDIQIDYRDDKMWWVVAGSGGISLSDKANRKKVDYFCLPMGKCLPPGLVISEDRDWDSDWKKADRGGTHYTIHPLRDMRRDRYIHLLGRLKFTQITS